MEQNELLPTPLFRALVEGLKSRDGDYRSEVEVGNPDGVFVGVHTVDESSSLTFYIYVADPGYHSEVDPTTATKSNRADVLYDETRKLRKISIGVQAAISSFVKDFEPREGRFVRYEMNEKEDIPEGGAYYVCEVQKSDIEFTQH